MPFDDEELRSFIAEEFSQSDALLEDGMQRWASRQIASKNPPGKHYSRGYYGRLKARAEAGDPIAKEIFERRNIEARERAKIAKRRDRKLTNAKRWASRKARLAKDEEYRKKYVERNRLRKRRALSSVEAREKERAQRRAYYAKMKQDPVKFEAFRKRKAAARLIAKAKK